MHFQGFKMLGIMKVLYIFKVEITYMEQVLIITNFVVQNLMIVSVCNIHM